MAWFRGTQHQEEQGWEVSAAEVARSLAGEGAPVLVDVREPDEWSGPLGHVAGSRLVPLGRLAGEAPALVESLRGRPVVTVCRSGARSLTAAMILRRAGLKDVRSMRGGMLQWNALRLPAER